MSHAVIAERSRWSHRDGPAWGGVRGAAPAAAATCSTAPLSFSKRHRTRGSGDLHAPIRRQSRQSTSDQRSAAGHGGGSTDRPQTVRTIGNRAEACTTTPWPVNCPASILPHPPIEIVATRAGPRRYLRNGDRSVGRRCGPSARGGMDRRSRAPGGGIGRSGGGAARRPTRSGPAGRARLLTAKDY